MSICLRELIYSLKALDDETIVRLFSSSRAKAEFDSPLKRSSNALPESLSCRDLPEELHIAKERRIACVVDGRSLFERNDKSAWDTARHAAAVQRLYHFDRSKVCLVLAA